jgi:hypothetical protein
LLNAKYSTMDGIMKEKTSYRKNDSKTVFILYLL